MAKAVKQPADYILPLYMSGLAGRMVRLSPPKKSKTEVLFVYGHHASLECYYGVMDLLNRYAGVTAPDLPGFGGMDAFYKIGEKPTLENFADYLATFIKWRYKKQRFIVVGHGLGIVIVTRMLQKYPELAKQIQMVVSLTGFSHHNDFNVSPRRQLLYRTGTKLCSRYLPAMLYKHILLRPSVIRYKYGRTYSGSQKTRGKDDEKLRQAIETEVALWRRSEPRTYMSTANMMLKLDLTKHGHIDLPIYHSQVEGDHLFNSVRVEQHLRRIYKDFIQAKIKAPKYAASLVATAEEAKPFLPTKFINVIKKVK